MILNNDRKRAIKGYVMSSLLSCRRHYIVIALIIAITSTVNPLIMLAFGLYGKVSGSTSSGGLNVALMISAVYMLVAAIVAASKKEISVKFTFPGDRLSYTLGFIIYTALSSVIFLILCSAALLIEIAGGFVIAAIVPEIEIISSISIANYFTGLLSSFSYLMLISSIVYCLFMYILKYKISFLIIISALLALLLILSPGRQLLLKGLSFVVLESSYLVFIIKAWVLIVILNALSLIPLKGREIKI